MAKHGSDGRDIKTRAMQRLAERRAASRRSLPPVADPTLVDELELHQIELELQNAELCRARAEAEAALARYTELYDFAPIGYFTLGARGTILTVNLLGARLLGVERAALLDRRLGAFVTSASLPDFNTALSKVQSGEDRTSCEVQLTAEYDRDGQGSWLQLTFAVAEDNTVRAVASDVTERRRLAAQLATAQRLEAVARLAGGVAHDFNNLLTVILAGAEAARADAPAGSSIQEDLQLVVDAAQRAAGLTRKLLAFGRKQLLRAEAVDVNALITGLATLLRTLLGGRSTLVLSLQPELRNILIDPVQLEQVIVNLALNARDAMPDGGQLTIATAAAEAPPSGAPPAVPVGSFAVISVSDTGVGMDHDVLGQIFEPFFTTKGRERGTGLGLASVAGIVAQSGGKITVRSTPGLGTTFDVYLPRTAESSAPASGKKPTGVVGGGHETILIVDDEAALRLIAERILAAAGYTVLAAGSGAEALRLLEQHPGSIDLLLSDVIMPGMTGPELARRVTSASPATRVLFMSGYADDILGKAGVLEQEVHFVAKPYTAQSLRAKVRETLG